MLPIGSAVKGTRGHTRRRASPRARQTGCPCTFCLGQPSCWSAHRRTGRPGDTPRPDGPKKESTQSERMRPRKLRVIRCHCALVVWRPHAGCVDRATGIVALLPFHDRLSRSPQPASRRSNRSRPANPSPNHPAAFCGRVPRLRRDPRPQNAVPQSSINLTYQSIKTPHTPRLLDPYVSLRINQKGVRYAHVHFELPPWGLVIPPGGSARWFSCGAAARAGERLENEAGEVSPDPSYCAREACRRRIPPQSVIPKVQPLVHMHTVILKAAGVPSPAVRSASIGRAVCAGLIRRWGRARTRRRAAVPALRGCVSRMLPPSPNTPCEARLLTQRPRTAYVFTVAPRTLFPRTSRQTLKVRLSS